MIELLASSTLNGVLFGLLLFMLSSGLTLIFSMMGVLNFAHASFYMLGAYLAYALGLKIGFWPALFVAPVLTGLIGAGVERFGLRRVHQSGHVAELLFTFGLAFLIEDVVKLVWGKASVPYEVPRELARPLFTLFGTNYPAFKALMMLVAVAMLIALWLLLKRTRAGLIVQAALTHPHMTSHLGHNVPLVFMMVFGVGCALAGLAGVIGGALLVTEPSMAETLGPIVFVVIVIGGMGSLSGAFAASLLIGLLQTFAVAVNLSLGDVAAMLGLPLAAGSDLARVTVAQIGPILPFLLMVLILIFRPRGLLGARET